MFLFASKLRFLFSTIRHAGCKTSRKGTKKPHLAARLRVFIDTA